MIIQKLNNVLVKHGKITFAVFTILIIVSFVLYVGSTSLFELISGPRVGSPDSKYGEALGRDISGNDVTEAGLIVSRINAALYGMAPNRVQSPDWDTSAQYAVLFKAADALNIQVSDKEVGEALRSLPAFQDANGNFSEKLYAEYHDKCLKPFGLDYADLEGAFRVMLKKEKLPLLTTANVILTDDERDAGIESLLQKITFNLITFDAEDFADQVTVEESEAKEFYTANQSLFMSEPESDGLLAFVPYAVKDESDKVTEEQLKDYYELRKATFIKADGTELAFDDVKDSIRKELGTTVETESAVEKAQAFNKAFRALVREDRDAYLADPQKFFREEAGKAGLQIIEIRNLTARTKADAELHIDAELVEAATILKNIGSFTNLERGEDGVSMFLLTARRPALVQPFEDVKETAQEYLISKKEYALAEEAADKLGAKFVEQKPATAAEVEALVKSLNGDWHAEITRSRFEIEANSHIPAANEILTTEPGMLSTPDKQLGEPVLVYVSAHTPATAEEIEESKAFLESELKLRKQSVVSRGLQDWVGSAVKVVVRGQDRN